MKKSSCFLIGAFLGLVLVWGSPTPGWGQERSYKFGGGTPGGPWFVAVGAGVTLLNQEMKGKAQFTFGASAGSLENVRRIGMREYDTGFAHVNTIWEAVNGVGPFAGRALQNFRLVAKHSSLTHLWFCLKESDIRSISDFAGRKINIGPPGSGALIHSGYILETLGLADKIKKFTLSFEGGAKGVADRQIDVGAAAGGPYSVPAIVEISTLNPVRYIGFKEEEYQKLEAKFPFYERVTIPAKVVNGVDEPVPGIGYSVYWIARDDMPTDVVYDMLRITQEPKNKEMLTKTQKTWGEVTGQFQGVARMGVKLHPGAAKYWKEKGMEIPAALLP